MIDPISQTILEKIGERAKAESGKQGIAYRRQCPRCMRWQVKETMLKQGCYACGWKPERRGTDEGD
ncbi:MAG: hypothetical protein Q8N60_04685 [Candidatus Diapherotrites archaeon]|nr:hypothetical protein [Candidatus Diapherotrites archaeon]